MLPGVFDPLIDIGITVALKYDVLMKSVRAASLNRSIRLSLKPAKLNVRLIGVIVANHDALRLYD